MNPQGNLETSWATADVGYFMPKFATKYNEPTHLDTGSDLVPRFYNVQAFVAHIRGILVFKNETVVRINLRSCLRDAALDWYNTELTDAERISLSTQTVEEGWIKKLVQRFQLPKETARFRTVTTDLIRKEVSASECARNLVRDAQAAGIKRRSKQMLRVWQRLLASHITFDKVPKPGPGTSMSEFMRAIDTMDLDSDDEYGEGYGDGYDGGYGDGYDDGRKDEREKANKDGDEGAREGDKGSEDGSDDDSSKGSENGANGS